MAGLMIGEVGTGAIGIVKVGLGAVGLVVVGSCVADAEGFKKRRRKFLMDTSMLWASLLRGLVQVCSEDRSVFVSQSLVGKLGAVALATNIESFERVLARILKLFQCAGLVRVGPPTGFAQMGVL